MKEIQAAVEVSVISMSIYKIGWIIVLEDGHFLRRQDQDMILPVVKQGLTTRKWRVFSDCLIGFQW